MSTVPPQGPFRQIHQASSAALQTLSHLPSEKFSRCQRVPDRPPLASPYLLRPAARRLRPTGEAHGWQSRNNWLRVNFPTAEEEAFAEDEGMSPAKKRKVLQR